ncbi:hypothetical protein [Hymenobacter sp.]|uniref:hypothetical protein n=1 Tax=Hymenobacter sp. TaxID=1898978 RepID=UPI00286D69BE|nr:hypothetical protein [Hymenobacter sp.]
MLVAATLSLLQAHAQLPGPTAAPEQALAATYLQEFRAQARVEAGRMWGVPLDGPVLLVKPDTRELYANEPDSAGRLRAEGSLFRGQWPAELALANTAVTWQGKRWSMLLWPLPSDAQARQHLAFHEFFHRVQPALGFAGLPEADNQHLDQQQGRVWLKLELEALKAALRAPQASQVQRAHVRHALQFRDYRRSLYPAAAIQENMLELNEGLAEYTGFAVVERNGPAKSTHLVSGIDTFYRNPTFVRSFAYCTVPAYGYLLQTQQPAWHRAVQAGTDLTRLFTAAFGYVAPPAGNRKAAAVRAAGPYGLARIEAAEGRREAERQRRISAYRQKFLLTPCLTIPLLQMNISFDPRNQQPLGPDGTVYPQLKLSDKWGNLTVSGGALLGAAWDKVTVPAPTAIVGQQISGEGYVLLLAPGWVVKTSTTGGTTLQQQDEKPKATE